jgi:hypothetical protein
MPINQAQPGLKFIPPTFNPLVLSGCQFVLPWWLKCQTNISNIQADNVETLVNLYRQFQDKKIRFLMAFRHPRSDDPLCMGYLLWQLVPEMAKQQGIKLKSPIHSHFMYDRGIPLWAGDIVAKLYSNLGGTSIMRGKIDREGLRSARDLFANSNFPIAAAPEGATNGHNEKISPIEPGISQLGFWCLEDIKKAGRNEEVLILPIGIQYYYLNEPWDEIAKVLDQLETEMDLLPGKEEGDTLKEEKANFLYYRLLRLGFKMLEVMENFYRKFYHQPLSDNKLNLEQLLASGTNTEELNTTLAHRLQSLLDVALQVAEQFFNIKGKGNFIDRCRRLEQAGWDLIYREDIPDIDALSPLERGLADRVAEEADLRMWHMRLVESFVAVSGHYIREKMTPERFAETTLLLWDVVAKIKGGNPFERPTLAKQRVEMRIGEPISISQRAEAYKTSRKNAVSQLTQDLQTALEGLIRV